MASNPRFVLLDDAAGQHEPSTALLPQPSENLWEAIEIGATAGEDQAAVISDLGIVMARYVEFRVCQRQDLVTPEE
jgi:hypothetical protein